MEATLEALGGILLRALPTFILVVLLHFYLKYVFFRPLGTVLHKRYEATEGARKRAEESMARAEAKIAEYEESMRAARAEVYQLSERLHRDLEQHRAQELQAAREGADAAIAEAKREMAADVAKARDSLAADTRALANQMADAVLRGENGMTKMFACVALVWLALSPALAQQDSQHGAGHGQAAEHPASDQHGNLEPWKWANFLVLAAILGYFVVKHGGPFFDARSRQIRKEMVEAEEIRDQAEQRAAAVDAKLANLQADIEALRQEARAEAAAETQRLRELTAAEIGKIQQHAEQEIAAAGKAARMELRRYSARLAVDMAEQIIRSRMNPLHQHELLQDFVQKLGRGVQAPQS